MFLAQVIDDGRTAALVTFVAIGVGALGSLLAGVVSDRDGRCEAAILALVGSGLAAVAVAVLNAAALWIVVPLVVVWGFWVVADSAQFSTIVTEVADQRYVGTALTLQLALGFALTVFTIFLVPVVRDAFGWGWAFALLVPGPVVGAWAMRRLERRVRPAPREHADPAT